jgi:hypothetical protein
LDAPTRQPPAQEQPRYARWLAALRERAVVGTALLGLGGGLLGGFATFWIASSRGLDNLDLGQLITAGWVILAVALLLGASVTLLWSDDPRAGVLLATLFVGSSVGSAAAFYLVPGDTTDGSLAVSIGEASAAADQQLAMCTWDRDAAIVTTIDQRGPMTVAAHVHVVGRVELAGAAQPAALALDVLAPFTFAPVARLSGSSVPTLDDATRRAGSVVVVDLAFEELPAAGDDPDLMLLVRHQLDQIDATHRATMTWECPRLP